ncbi:relaxase/mobilization nuclease domain-containing protein [Rhodobacter sp. TJ_12]|uniref:relaxase/mobilization nuclease domain-containing protein n=1 Tax=Rhodobacter sp. TJ_12 TaxID=2029399 RepID=UPI003989F1CE
MICEIITKGGEPGSGGSRDAFYAGVRYISEKAASVELRNLTGQSWTTAAEEMAITSQLSKKVQKPYYHLVLSWHESEHPTTAQQIAATRSNAR